MSSKPPIFILGVPRSGTTLLRAILDSHSAIACGPETPWFGGHQPRSLMALWSALRVEPWGYCKSYGMPESVATRAARQFLTTLMDEYASARGKKRWAEKTPDNALHVAFLAELYPEAKFVHLVRDGLDVAMSTSVVAPHRQGISNFLEQRIGFGPAAPAVPNSPLAALLRWRHWNRVIEDSLAQAGVRSMRLTYERLVSEPEPTVRELTAFIDEPFEPSMLDYARARHEYPEWEWGSADVRTKPGISTSAVGRARRELSEEMYQLLAAVTRGDSSITAPAVLPAGATLSAAESEFISAINAFSAAMGLDTIAPAQQAAAAWLWQHGLAGHAWRGLHVFSTGPFWHPLAWVPAFLGARVTMIGPEPPSTHVALARNLGVAVEWIRSIPHGFAADAMLAFTPFDASVWQVLKPGGIAFAAGVAAESVARVWPAPIPLKGPIEAAVLIKPA